MSSKYRETLKDQPDLEDYNNWPRIKVSSLDVGLRSGFKRNQGIILSYLAGNTLVAVARKYGVSEATVRYTLNRCLECKGQNPPALTKGLIPWKMLNGGQRQLPLEATSKINSEGSRGALYMTLRELPDLEKNCRKLAISALSPTSKGEKVSKASFVDSFIRHLESLNWPVTKWPLNQDREGYVSIGNYYDKLLAELKIKKPKAKSQKLVAPRAKRALEEIEIDEQITDLFTSVDLYLDNHHKPLRLSRVSVALALCVATDACLGYVVCLTAHPNHQDILKLLEQIQRRWQPLELATPGVVYAPGAGFPNALEPYGIHIQPGTIKLDNALAHHANRIRSYICNTMNASINYGRPASPKSRNFVEYAFRRLNRMTHRAPSTTGSGPSDPKRASGRRAKEIPVVKLHEFEEMLEVVISAHNAKPQARLGGSSPLEMIEHQLETLPIPLQFDNLDRSANPFQDDKEVKVKTVPNENRSPFVNFQGMRYNGDCLCDPNIVGSFIRIHFDIHDIRKLEARTLTGDVLGEIVAPLSRQHFALSIRTQRKMNKRARKVSGFERKTVDQYFNALIDGGKPVDHTELIRVFREINVDGQVDLRAKNDDNFDEASMSSTAWADYLLEDK